MKTKYKATFSAALALLALFAASTSAQAQGLAVTEKGGSTTTESVNANCELGLKVAASKGFQPSQVGLCKVALTTSVSTSRPVTNADLVGLQSNMVLGDFTSLALAVNLGTVRSRSYYQQVANLSNTESQSGTFYFDGTRVWVTESYRGFTGSHRCQIERAAIFSVTPQNCFESGSTSTKTLSQQWLFTVNLNAGVVSLPISWSETYALRVDSLGQTW